WAGARSRSTRAKLEGDGSWPNPPYGEPLLHHYWPKKNDAGKDRQTKCHWRTDRRKVDAGETKWDERQREWTTRQKIDQKQNQNSACHDRWMLRNAFGFHYGNPRR